MSTHTASVAYSQVHLAPADVDPILDPTQPAELSQVTNAGRGLIILTGIAMGPIIIDVRTGNGEHTAGPPWQEREVTSMHVDQPLYISSPTVDDPNEMEGLDEPVFSPQVAGRHIVTVLARGRDIDPDGIREDPCEEYLVLLEPAG